MDKRRTFVLERDRVLKGLCVIVLIIALLLLLLYGRQKKADSLAAVAEPYDSFIYQNTLYTVSSATDSLQFDTRYFLRAEGSKYYLQLPGEAVRWCDVVERFVYTDGNCVRTCNIDGRNRETVYTISDGKYAQIKEVIDYYAVIRRAEKLAGGASGPAGGYDIVDLVDGTVYEARIGDSATYAENVLDISDGWLYYSVVSMSGGENSISRCKLATGQRETLTAASVNTIEFSCVADGYLYFNYEYGAVCRVPVQGGELEQLSIDFEAVGAKNATGVAEYDGVVYVICYCHSDDMNFLRVFSLEPETCQISEVASVEADSRRLLNLHMIDGEVVLARLGDASLRLPILER